ncbi:MAG TPA: hypothetical protein VHV78_10005, partial [Gemmatimonadaceae bacterium]|nr:hypothetical protein [Gemmatimonadaceae bacterium]
RTGTERRPPSGATTLFRGAPHERWRNPVPDPASRSQPSGVHEASEAIDPCAFAGSDADWNGLDIDELVIYELHMALSH